VDPRVESSAFAGSPKAFSTSSCPMSTDDARVGDGTNVLVWYFLCLRACRIAAGLMERKAHTLNRT